MNAYAIKLTYHVRAYAFGGRLIPEMLGKRGVPEGVVAETWEVSDYRETTGMITNCEYVGKTLHDLVVEFRPYSQGSGRGSARRTCVKPS
jgi:mannose-6-phosphate isomerase